MRTRVVTDVLEKKQNKIKEAKYVQRNHQARSRDNCCRGKVVNVKHMNVSIIVQQDATMYSLLYFCKLLYTFN